MILNEEAAVTSSCRQFQLVQHLKLEARKTEKILRDSILLFSFEDFFFFISFIESNDTHLSSNELVMCGTKIHRSTSFFPRIIN